jgi:imidazolonepropionase-like amidohydrolase
LVFAHGDNVRELEIMIDYGMSPAAALVAATSGNAMYFRQASASRRPTVCGSDRG